MMRPSRKSIQIHTMCQLQINAKVRTIMEKNMCLQNIYVILTPDLLIVITITKTKRDGIEQYKLFRFSF